MSQGFSGQAIGFAGNGITQIFVNGIKQNSTSGTEIDFTIPSGVKEIKVMVDGLSGSGTDEPLVQLGDSGGVEASGYLGSGSNQSTSLGSLNSTTGFLMDGNNGAADIIQGMGTLSLLDAATNTWVWSFVGGKSNFAAVVNGGGSKSLSGELTTVRLTWTGSNTFDAGSVNVQYDNPDPAVVADVQPGTVLQVVQNSDGELASTTTTIPLDDTIPQNTEGGEFITVSITPRKANSILKIEASTFTAHSATGWVTLALFRDSETDALAVNTHYQLTSTASYNRYIQHFMTAGSTNSMTFKLRIGSNTAGTLRINSDGASRVFGGTASTVISVTEIAA